VSRREAIERLIPIAIGEVVAWHDVCLVLGSAGDSGIATGTGEANQSRGVMCVDRTEEPLIDEQEDRDVGADADAQSEHRHDGECRAAAELTHPVENVAKQVFEGAASARAGCTAYHRRSFDDGQAVQVGRWGLRLPSKWHKSGQFLC
jgi:hypothetical protein